MYSRYESELTGGCDNFDGMNPDQWVAVGQTFLRDSQSFRPGRIFVANVEIAGGWL
jgi:hypothetical protein